MSTHIGIDIGSTHTDVVVHVQSAAGDGGQLTTSRFGSAPELFLAGLDGAVRRSGALWDDVALLACATSASEPGPALQRAAQPALRQHGFRGQLYFMQPDASLSTSAWDDARSAPVAGMVAASVLSRQIGEMAVLALDVGATGARCALLRNGRLATTGPDAALEVLHGPLVEGLRRHCARAGQDPQACTVLAFGGGGAAVTVELARELRCARVVMPRHAAAFSAWGLLQAERRITQTVLRVPGLDAQTVFEQLRARVLREAAIEGLAEEDLRFQHVEEPGRYRVTSSSLVTTSRLQIQPSAGLPALGTGGGSSIDVDQLPPGTILAGPVQIRGETRGLFLPAWAMLTVDSYGNLVVEVAHGPAPAQPPIDAGTAAVAEPPP